MNKPWVIFLVGLPGSGKSTMLEHWKMLSHIVAEQYTVISLDNQLYDYASKHGITYNEAFHQYAKTAAKNIQDELQRAITDEYNIVIDMTNLTSKGRRKRVKFIDDFSAHGYAKYAVVFEVDENELKKRRKRRTGKVIPDHVISAMRNSYTPPSVDEGFDEIFYF